MTRVMATISILLFVGALPTLAQPRVEKARLSVVADRTAYSGGEIARLASVVEIDHGWHINSHTPTFDYLIPTELRTTVPEGWKNPAVEYPPHRMASFGFAEEPIAVYEGELVILASVPVPAGVLPGLAQVDVELTYQACNDRQCLPPVTTSAAVEMTLGESGRAAGHPAFEGRDHEAAVGQSSTSIPLILVLALLGGLILNAMPCVLPVLSLKVFGLIHNADQGRREVTAGALATSLGILVSFWALALAAIAARSAGQAVGWGVQFQEPVFVTSLLVVVLLFSLNMWGLFEIPLPGRLANLAGRGPRQGLGGHFVSGLFATLMATPCSAPFLGTAMGFALAQEGHVIVLVFTAVGTGMALPYLLLAAAPGAAGLLPKPGPWMELLKGNMAFLLAAAGVWLLYVLSNQVSRERTATVELVLLGLSLMVWLQSAGLRSPLLRRLAWAGVVLSAIGSVLVVAGASEGALQRADGDGVVHLIPWEKFDRQRAESVASGGRLVFVDVTADWCFTCKVNERLVLETPEIAEAFERHQVLPMKADWTNRNPQIARYLADFGRGGIPFYLIYRPGGGTLLLGELLTKESVLSALEEAADS